MVVVCDAPTIDPFTSRLIRRKARELVATAGMCRQDRDDVAQELTLRLLQRLRRYNPCPENRNGYVTVMVRNLAADLLKEHLSQEAERPETESLNDLVEDGDEGLTQLCETYPEYERRSHLGLRPRNDADRADLRHDVAAVMAQLPDELRDVCQRLMQFSVAETARQLDMPRTTLIDLIHKLRAHFERAGIDASF